MTRPVINLFSDTVTKPTPGMYEAMVTAEVGDDMFAEDPTVNRLEEMAADLLGKEAAMFACSCTMSNQIAVGVHCRPGDDLLIHETGHIGNYEAGAPAVLSGVTCRQVPGANGMPGIEDLETKLSPPDQHFTRTAMVCVENTTNLGGGRVWPMEQLNGVADWAHQKGLKVHLDGARLFNAVVAGGRPVSEIVENVDTVSICFSKGLGCPMGSILVGNADDIAEARRIRKRFGGALRQAGVIAATAIYSLENHVDRLADDHANARTLAKAVNEIEGLSVDVNEVETNLVFFTIDPSLGTAAQLVAALRERGVRMGALGKHRLRACTHLDVTESEVLAAAETLADCMRSGIATEAAGVMTY